MDFGKIVKVLIAIAVIIFIWKKGIPWAKESFSSGSSTPSASSGSSGAAAGCADRAAQASEAWGSGLRQYVNPPYDLESWGRFKSSVDAKVSMAEAGCGCDLESCRQAQGAMRDLRTLVSEMDLAIRGGTSVPSDAVTRQESIDDAIDQARQLAQSGK
jgi:hypothetical protein